MGPSEPALPGSATKLYVISKLVWDNSNWITLVTFSGSHRTTWHIEGTTSEPPVIPTFPTSQLLTPEEDEHLERAEKWWDEYHQCKAMVKGETFIMVPESLLIVLCKLKTVKDMWELSVLSMKAKHWPWKLTYDAIYTQWSARMSLKSRCT